MDLPEDMLPSDPAGTSLVEPGAVIGGKYRVERLLGEGGMGVVVAAMHIELQERVAIKLMLPSLVGHTESAARFVREARATFGIKSEHVARLLDFGKLADGSPFMVMEYLQGQTLAAHLDRDDTIDTARAVDIVIEACAGVADAHRLGIIHRDLKPENLFLTATGDGRVVVKVLDFGISKADLENLAPTRTEGGMGTPAYAAPEQLRCAGDAGPGADIWSLGVVLFELLTGRLPFRAGSFAEMCAAVLTQRPPLPRTIRESIPEGLETIVMRCLETEPERRFLAVSDLVVALATYASEEGRAVAARVDGRATGTHRLPALLTPPVGPQLAPLRQAEGAQAGEARQAEEASLSGCERDASPLLLTRRRSRFSPVARPATALAALTCVLVVLGGGLLGHGSSDDTDAVAMAATVEGSILSVHSAAEAPRQDLPDGGTPRPPPPPAPPPPPSSSPPLEPLPPPAAEPPSPTPAPPNTTGAAARAAAAFRGFGGRK